MHNITNIISIYSVLIPLLVGLVFFGRYSHTGKLMLVLLVLAAIPQLATPLIKSNKVGSIYNLYFIYNMYLICEVTFWALIFFLNINGKSKWVITVLFSMYVGVFLYLCITEGTTNRFFSELACLENLLQVCWVCTYFYQVYKSDNLFKIELTPMFWFCMAILIYAPCSYFLFAFKKQIQDNPAWAYLWQIHDILNTVFYLLIATGLYVNNKRLNQNRHWNQNISY